MILFSCSKAYAELFLITQYWTLSSWLWLFLTLKEVAVFVGNDRRALRLLHCLYQVMMLSKHIAHSLFLEADAAQMSFRQL